MDKRRALNAFLGSVEQRAFRMAVYATKDRDDALDIVQDTMLRLADRYGGHDEADWPRLFFRILERRILDCHRRKRVKRALLGAFKQRDNEGDDGVATVVDPAGFTPERRLIGEQALERLEAAIAALPLRQQQVFLLREMQGFDVRQTAKIMQCSSGSVKTHLFRAQQTLRERLGDLIA